MRGAMAEAHCTVNSEVVGNERRKVFPTLCQVMLTLSANRDI